MQIKTVSLLPKYTRVWSDELHKKLRKIDAKTLSKNFGVAKSTARNYRAGLHKPELHNVGKMHFKKPLSYGLGSGGKEIYLPSKINVNKDLLWFIGFWNGDKDDSSTRIGICSSDKEIAQKSKEVLQTFVGSDISVEVEIPVNFSGDLLKGINKKRIKFQRKKPCYSVRVYRSLFRKFFLNLVKEIENNLQRLDEYEQIALVSGFIDAEGTINHKRRNIRVYQKKSKKGKKMLRNFEEILKLNVIKTSKISVDKDDYYFDILSGKNVVNLKKFKEKSYMQCSRKIEKLSLLLPH